MEVKNYQYKKLAHFLNKNFFQHMQLDEKNLGLNEVLACEGDFFAASWNNLHQDEYMGDGGTYRYRRYSVVKVNLKGDVEFLPPEPHFQRKTYNSLNGDLYRHYSPFEDKVLKGNLFRSLILFMANILNLIERPKTGWRIECHQFRILPTNDEPGLPTPEGKHQDGVEYVLITFLGKLNVVGGETSIYDNDTNHIYSFTMKDRWESVLLKDTKILHEVSPINKKNSMQEAFRDVLVLTFRGY